MATRFSSIGDASDNGKPGGPDASFILQCSILLISFGSYSSAARNAAAAFYNKPVDGSSITANDTSLAVQNMVGLITTFPIQTAIPDRHCA